MLDNLLLFTLYILHKAVIYRLAEETTCHLAFWNTLFSIFPMFMINRIRENSSVQDRSSSCRVPSPRQRIYCGDFQGSDLQGVIPWMEELFEMVLYAPTTFKKHGAVYIHSAHQSIGQLQLCYKSAKSIPAARQSGSPLLRPDWANTGNGSMK